MFDNYRKYERISDAWRLIYTFIWYLWLQMEHYLQVVKTEVITRKDYKLVEEYEYTAHSSVAQSLHIPVAKFHLELSPMQVCKWRLWISLSFRFLYKCSWFTWHFLWQVLITENPKSFSHFLTNVCAIIGGVFTVCISYCGSATVLSSIGMVDESSLWFSGCWNFGLHFAQHY